MREDMNDQNPLFDKESGGLGHDQSDLETSPVPRGFVCFLDELADLSNITPKPDDLYPFLKPGELPGGKSALVKQFASETGIKLVDVRLSQGELNMEDFYPSSEGS